MLALAGFPVENVSSDSSAMNNGCGFVRVPHVVLWCVCVVTYACSASSPSTGDVVDADTVVVDSGDDIVTAVDTSGDASDASTATGLPAPNTVLLVDFDMRPAGSWARVVEGFAQQGYSVAYRRWYPHLTQVDVSPDGDDQYPYRIIVVAAGGGLAHATARMTLADGAHLQAFLEDGGNVVWAPSNGWSDSVLGESEWVVGNRMLEALGVGVRVERNTVIGNVVIAAEPKPPLHKQSAAYYPGTLEWSLDYPVLFGAPEHATIGSDLSGVAGGHVPTISCDDDAVAVLARVPWQSILWWHHMNTDDQLSYASGQEPVSVIARPPNGGGFVTVVPSPFLTLEDGSGRPAVQPLLAPAILDNATALGRRIITAVVQGADAPTDFAPGGCSAGRLPLFSAAAPGLEPVGAGSVAMANQPVPPGVTEAAPPVPPAWSPSLVVPLVPSEPIATTLTPTWFRANKARIGYAELQSVTATDETLSQWTALGVDAFVMVTNTALLSMYDGTGFMEEQAAALSVKAVETNAHVLLGVHYIDPYGAMKGEIGSALGPQGAPIQAPSPLSDAWWDGPILDMFLGGAAVQAAHAGIAGISLDMELYGASSLWYRDGHAFDADCWNTITSALQTQDQALGATAEAMPAGQRYDWLMTKGLWAFAIQALEDAVAVKAAAVLMAARAVSANMEVGLYVPTVSQSWFYRGLIRGFGSATKPVVILSYDLSTTRSRAWLNAEGLHTLLVSGFIGTLFSPADVGAGLVHSASESDGYWLFQLKDFPVSDDPAVTAKMHAPSSEYFDAVQAANDVLDGVPVD